MGKWARRIALGRAERIVEHSCVRRIVSLITFISIAICGGGYLVVLVTLYATGVLDRLPESVRDLLGAFVCVGLLGAVIISAIVGEVIRRAVRRAMLGR